MGLLALDIDDKANSTGIVLEAGVVQPLLWRRPDGSGVECWVLAHFNLRHISSKISLFFTEMAAQRNSGMKKSFGGQKFARNGCSGVFVQPVIAD